MTDKHRVPVRYPAGVSVTRKVPTGKFDPDNVVAGDRVVLREAVHKTAVIPIEFGDGTTETDTGFDLPADGMVLKVWLNVKTVEVTGGTPTVDVGLLSSESGGDADGFLDGVSNATAGLIKGTLDSGGQTLGLLLSVDEDGVGTLVPEEHQLTAVTARSVSWTPGSADHAEFVGDIVIEYVEYRDQYPNNPIA